MASVSSAAVLNQSTIVIKDKRLIGLSKNLSWLLRHGAEKEGFQFLPGGFLNIDDVLKHKNFKRYTLTDIETVVKNDEKGRFTIKKCPITNRPQIRANQGHSLNVDDLELTPIFDPASAPIVVHGTYSAKLPFIQKKGLSRMNRDHIHFSACEPSIAISGIRKSCDVFIYINLEKAIRDGIKFYRSTNNVILSPGNECGFIPPDYFSSIVHKNS